MIKFLNIEIFNFKSIEYINLRFPEGLTELRGSNLDLLPHIASNGTGKSSLLTAIPQCLFNKNPDTELGLVNNTITKKAYRIILTIQKAADTYIIDNNRDRNLITITNSKGVILTTRIRESLKYIEHEILKLSYTEFMTLAFITSDSLKSVINLTSANLLLKFFNLQVIEEYVTKLKMERRLLNKEVVNLRGTKNSHSTLQLSKLLGQIQELEKEEEDARIAYDLKYIDSETITNLSTEIAQIKEEIKMAEIGVCPTCHQVVASNKDIHTLNTQLSEKVETREALQTKVDNAYHKLAKIKQELALANAQRIALLEVKNELVVDNSKKINQKTNKISIINDTLKVIESGMVHQIYLNKFLFVLNRHLKSLIIPHIEVRAELQSSSIVYKIRTDGATKQTTQLSGGELTLTSLIVLTSIYKTLQELLNIDINLLILDEAIHKVDDVNQEYISNIISQMNKNIVVVQHKEYINSDIFDNLITVIKKDGLTTLKYKEK